MGSVLPVVFMCITALIFTGTEAEWYTCTEPEFNVEDSNYCYEKIEEQRTHSDAKTDCSTRGNGLVEITSKDINDAVLDRIKANANEYYWIGGTKDAEGNWYWPTAVNQWNFTDLKDDTSINSKCLSVVESVTMGRGWFTRSCDEKHGYICQYERDSPTSSATTVSSTTKQTSHPPLNTTNSPIVSQSLTTSASKLISSSLSTQITSTGVSSLGTIEITHKTTNQQRRETHSTAHIETTTKQPIGKQTTTDKNDTKLSLTNKTDIDSLIAKLARQCEAERQGQQQQQELKEWIGGFNGAELVSFAITLTITVSCVVKYRRRKKNDQGDGGQDCVQHIDLGFKTEYENNL